MPFIKPYFLFVSLLVLIFYSFRLNDKTDGLTEIKKFGINKGNLKMFVYNPFIEKDNVKRALVIVLHGCNQSANGVSELTGWNKIAKTYKFYVLYPEQKRSNNASVCFNWFNTKDISKDKGECSSIYEMIGRMKNDFAIDSTKIFVTGMSAGAAMSVALLSVYPQTFKEGAVFAGGPFKSAINPIESVGSMLGKKTKTQNEWAKLVTDENSTYKGNYPSLIIYQGTKDPIVNYKNSFNLISQWTGIQNCDTIADETKENFTNISQITCYKYKNADDKTIVRFYSIEDLGHKYLNKPGEMENEGGKKGPYSYELNFHSTYQTALDFGLIIK